MVKTRRYPSKLLLFGEYTILRGGDALAMPLGFCFGKWKRGYQDPRLKPFFEYLKSLDYIDSKAVDLALDEGLSFESNIPEGYGLGSSGALTAASYDLFGPKGATEIALLKKHLSELEAFFHGSSSGLDPLTSYLSKPVIHTGGQLDVLEHLPYTEGLFLLDSGLSRDSSLLIELFREKLKSKQFSKAVDQLIKLNCAAIDQLRNQKKTELKASFAEISRLQWIHFREMITDSIKDIWQEGLGSGRYSVKLSGAGGGGFYLGIGDIGDMEAVRKISGASFSGQDIDAS